MPTSEIMKVFLIILLFPISSFSYTILMEKDNQGRLRPTENPQKIQDWNAKAKYAYTINSSEFLSGVYEKEKIYNLLYPNELRKSREVHRAIANILNHCLRDSKVNLNIPRYKGNLKTIYSRLKQKKKKPNLTWAHGKKYQECFNNMYCQNYSAYKGIGRTMPKRFNSRIRKDCADHVIGLL